MHLFPSGEYALRQKPPEGRFCNRSKCLPPLTEARLESTNGGPPRSFIVNPAVLEYETLIALNQLKVHRSATVTLALQSIAMSFPAAGHPAMVGAGLLGRKTEHRAGDRRHPPPSPRTWWALTCPGSTLRPRVTSEKRAFRAWARRT